jgi:hypothetical protein
MKPRAHRDPENLSRVTRAELMVRSRQIVTVHESQVDVVSDPMDGTAFMRPVA